MWVNKYVDESYMGEQLLWMKDMVGEQLQWVKDMVGEHVCGLTYTWVKAMLAKKTVVEQLQWVNSYSE